MITRFPGLGLEFSLRRWAFEVFGLPIYWYGIIIALAFLVAVILAVRSTRKYDLEPDNILDVVLFAAPTALVFARLYYVIFSWDMYKNNLVDILKVRDGGLAIYGGVIGAFLAAILYARYKKIRILHLMDFGVPYLVLGQSIGRWGNFVNQEAFGSATSLPWRMNGDVPDAYLRSLQEDMDLSKWGVHPTFLYESLWNFAVFLFLIYFRKRKKLEGEVLSLYLILYGVGRFFIEGLRTDSLMLGSIRVSQLLSLLLVLVFTVLFIARRMKKSRKEVEEPVSLGQSEYGSLLKKLHAEEEKDIVEKTEDNKEAEEAASELSDINEENDIAEKSDATEVADIAEKNDAGDMPENEQGS